MTENSAKSIIERGVTLTKRRKEDGEDLAELYKEAASNGFDKAAIKEAIAIASDPKGAEKLQAKSERTETVRLYLQSFGMSA